MGLALLRTAITDSLTLSEDLKVREVFSAHVSSSMLLFIDSQSNNLVLFFLCLLVNPSRADLIKGLHKVCENL